jgi:metal-responsive CopG/Arc/MetJ family transcriptional regulator
MSIAVSKITVTIPKELSHTLDAEVRQMNTTRSQLVKEAIEHYLGQKKNELLMRHCARVI